MKLVVFGATGGVGRRLVELALSEGHWVTAAVRNPDKLPIAHERLQIVACDALDPATLDPAIAGQDAALCALGSADRGPTRLYSTGARNIVRRMRAHGVLRLVFLSNFGVMGEKARGLRQALLLSLARRVLRDTLADHRRALDEIGGHVPEWIVARPLPMNDGPRTGVYRVAVDNLPAHGTRISRADVADFMLRQVMSDIYLHRLPAIAY